MERPGDVVFNVTKTYTTRERAHADVGVHVQLVMVQLEHMFVPALCGGGGRSRFVCRVRNTTIFVRKA